MFCSRRCRASLPPGDALAVLCALADKPACAPLGPHLLALLAEPGRCSEVELRAYLGPLVGTLASPLRIGPSHASVASAGLRGLRLAQSELAAALVAMTVHSPALHTQLYWLLEVAAEDCTGLLRDGHREVQQMLVAALGRCGDSAARLLRGRRLIAALGSVEEGLQATGVGGGSSLALDSVRAFYDGMFGSGQPPDDAKALARGEAPPPRARATSATMRVRRRARLDLAQANTLAQHRACVS